MIHYSSKMKLKKHVTNVFSSEQCHQLFACKKVKVFRYKPDVALRVPGG
jgi:hypothetical protein